MTNVAQAVTAVFVDRVTELGALHQAFVLSTVLSAASVVGALLLPTVEFGPAHGTPGGILDSVAISE